MIKKSTKLQNDPSINAQSLDVESALEKGYGLLIEKLDTPLSIYQWLTYKQQSLKNEIFNS